MEQTETRNVEQVAFNPFTTLSADQISALAGSFNKQWRDAHALDIALAQTEHGISENEAVFTAWLKAETDSIMDRLAVTSAVGYINNMLQGVAMPSSSEVSLGLIEGRYNELKVSLRKTVGVRVRDYATGKWTAVSSGGILDKVYKHLGITEKDWMR